MRRYKYKNILLFTSPQFSGNIDEYFIKNTEKLVLYITMPRFNNKFNIVKHYEKGSQLSEEKVKSSGNIFLYYFLWYITYLKTLFKFFPSKQKVYVITWQPYFFIGGTIHKMFRNVEYVYWIGDYFPTVSLPLKIYESVKKYYATHLKYVCYLSDRINAKMNGKVLATVNKKTIAWGVKPLIINPKKNKDFILCFIGVIKPSQGLEVLLESVKKNKNISLKILGSGDSASVEKYQKLILSYNINDRVWFPNKMFYNKEIEKEVKDCFVGIALYDVNKNSATYYADPGKIKTYAQYGLPILMTPIADVEKYIKKFGAGEVVSQNVSEIEAAIKKMKRNFTKYQKGLAAFNEYFGYEKYYNKQFLFLEQK